VKASLKLEMIPFGNCDHSITRINIPTSLNRIGDCIFTNLRVPPLIIPIPESMLYRYKSMFSLELPENMMRETNAGSFEYCYCLRILHFRPMPMLVI